MDIRIDYAERQLTTFLEEELSGAYLGVGEGARAHLDGFRSFLHAFYVGKFGNWPPRRSDGVGDCALSKATYFSMCFDFRKLYEYLMDEQTGTILEFNRPLDGELLVLQNVIAAFDRRHRYTPLPHPLPLLPDLLAGAGRHRPRDARRLSHTFSKSARANRRTMILTSLSAATNAHNSIILKNPLVRAYMTFERDYTLKQDERVSATEARKARWILIYAVLQTLLSVAKTPPEVRHTQDVSYNLCCQTAGTPPWTIPGVTTTTTTTPTAAPMVAVSSDFAGLQTPKLEMQPDRRSYFEVYSSPSPSQHPSSSGSTTTTHTDDSENITLSARPAPLPLLPPLALHRRLRPRRRNFSEIVIPGYGNGLSQGRWGARPKMELGELPSLDAIVNDDNHNNDDYDLALTPISGWSDDDDDVLREQQEENDDDGKKSDKSISLLDVDGGNVTGEDD